MPIVRQSACSDADLAASGASTTTRNLALRRGRCAARLLNRASSLRSGRRKQGHQVSRASALSADAQAPLAPARQRRAPPWPPLQAVLISPLKLILWKAGAQLEPKAKSPSTQTAAHPCRHRRPALGHRTQYQRHWPRWHKSTKAAASGPSTVRYLIEY